MQFWGVMRRRLFGLLVLFVAAGCDDDPSGPKVEATVAGISWTARVDTTGAAPHLVGVTIIGRNLNNYPVTFYHSRCPVEFRVLNLVDGVVRYDEAPPAPGHGRFCLNAPSRKVVLPPGDSLAFRTETSVPLLLGVHCQLFNPPCLPIEDGSYRFVAIAHFFVTDDVSSWITTPELDAGTIRLRRQHAPIPSVILAHGMETKTWLQQSGDTARIIVEYLNVSDTTQVIPFYTLPCGSTLDVAVYRERSARDHAYINPGAVVIWKSDNGGCVLPSLNIPSGQSRFRQVIFKKSELVAAGGPGTYYFAAHIYAPNWRIQSAGEITVP